MASINSCGSDTLLIPELPDWVMMVDTMPCTMENTASINSSPYVTAPLASAKRMNSLSACSGFLTSAKLPQVFITPMAKNSTSSP